MEGRAEGRMEGRAENQKATALQMLRMDRFTLEDIAEITRLDLDAIRALAAQGTADARENVNRAEIVREEKTATVRQLLKMGGFSLESMAEITRLPLEEVRAIAESEAR